MIFVTGGTGLIGSHLLIELSKKEDKITAIYRDKSKIEDVKQCFSYYLAENADSLFTKINWVECDLLDIPQLEEAMLNHTEVYHCAGFVSFHKGDFNKLMEINRVGTTNMINVSLHWGINKFGVVSSTAAVGNKDVPSHQEITEEGKWVKTDQTSAYSISKYNAEREVWRGINEGLNAVIVNPSIVLGAGKWDKGSLSIFDTIHKGMPFYPSGANSFVDARDVAAILCQLMEKNIFNQRYICTGKNITYKELFSKIAFQLGKKPPKYSLTTFLLKIGYIFSNIWAILTFSSSRITRDVVRSSTRIVKYSNQKIVKELNYNFFDFDATIQNAVEGRIL